jgi:hypothetical protein
MSIAITMGDVAPHPSRLIHSTLHWVSVCELWASFWVVPRKHPWEIMNISNPPIQSLQLLFVINSLHQVEPLLSARARNLQSTFSTNGWVNSILIESSFVTRLLFELFCWKSNPECSIYLGKSLPLGPLAVDERWGVIHSPCSSAHSWVLDAKWNHSPTFGSSQR